MRSDRCQGSVFDQSHLTQCSQTHPILTMLRRARLCRSWYHRVAEIAHFNASVTLAGAGTSNLCKAWHHVHPHVIRERMAGCQGHRLQF